MTSVLLIALVKAIRIKGDQNTFLRQPDSTEPCCLAAS
jgi:hypothetical protein